MSEPATPRGYAHVRDGIVVNATLWDGITNVSRPDEIEIVPLPYVTDEDGTIRYTAGIGWSYRDGQFVDERPVEDEDEH